jgi:hypothetical protein
MYGQEWRLSTKRTNAFDGRPWVCACTLWPVELPETDTNKTLLAGRVAVTQRTPLVATKQTKRKCDIHGTLEH